MTTKILGLVAALAAASCGGDKRDENGGLGDPSTGSYRGTFEQVVRRLGQSLCTRWQQCDPQGFPRKFPTGGVQECIQAGVNKIPPGQGSQLGCTNDELSACTGALDVQACDSLLRGEQPAPCSKC